MLAISSDETYLGGMSQTAGSQLILTRQAADEHYYDVGRFAQKLKRLREHRPFIDQVEKLKDLKSTLADLEMAAESCGAMAEKKADIMFGGKLWRSIGYALQCHAILFYARGLKTRSQTRRTFDIRAKLDDEGKAAHKKICELRDDAIAHFGSGTHYNQGLDYAAETAVFRAIGNRSSLDVVVKRAHYDGDLAKLLTAQIERARVIMTEDFHRQRDAVFRALVGIIESNPTLKQMFLDTEFQIADLGRDPNLHQLDIVDGNVIIHGLNDQERADFERHLREAASNKEAAEKSPDR